MVVLIMSKDKYDVYLTTDSKEIIATGTVFQFENEKIIVRIDDINIKLSFENDENIKPMLKIEYQNEKNIKFHLINYDSELGVGLTKPICIGQLDDRDFYFICRVSAIGTVKGNRMIGYTFYWEKKDVEE